MAETLYKGGRGVKVNINYEGYLANADTGEKVIFYDCDPEKHQTCGKRDCKPLGYHGPGACDMTKFREYKADGGRAFYIRDLARGLTREDSLARERIYIDEEELT
jgi:hypothetical protein